MNVVVRHPKLQALHCSKCGEVKSVEYRVWIHPERMYEALQSMIEAHKRCQEIHDHALKLVMFSRPLRPIRPAVAP